MITTTIMTAAVSNNESRSSLKPCSLDALDAFNEELFKAYHYIGERYLETLTEIEKSEGGVSDDNKKKLQRLPFQLWASISAASKRAKRQIVFNALLEQRDDYGVDIPPSVVHHVGRVLLGHGFDEKVAMRVFAQKGRTAADKTDTTVQDLLPVIERIQYELVHFEVAMQGVRAEQEQIWYASEQYERIYRTIAPYFSRGDITPQRLVKPV